MAEKRYQPEKDVFLAKYLDQRFDKLEELIREGGKKTMSALTDLSEAIADLSTSQGEQSASLANIAADIVRLQKQIADGGGITEAQLQPSVDALKAAAAASKSFSAELKTVADSVPDDVSPNPLR